MMGHKGVSLIGMPASGKSTICKKLASALSWPLLDIDLWMEAHEGMPLKQIIDTKGKDYALDLETSCIRDTNLFETVLSTPGSIIYNDVLDVLQQQTHIIWLDVPFSTLEARLAPDIENERGIIGLKEKGLKGLYDERTPFYEKWATHRIDCEEKSVSKIVKEIIAIVA